MTQDQSSKHGNLGLKGNDLQAAIENYQAKASAKATADAAFEAAKTALDLAKTAFDGASASFASAFPLPAGYTPPTP